MFVTKRVFFNSDVASFEPTEYGLETSTFTGLLWSVRTMTLCLLTFSEISGDDKDVDITCLTMIFLQGKG